MACSAVGATRKGTEIWLVGQPSSSLNSTKLPSRKEVMAVFFHYKQGRSKTITNRDASHSTANDVLAVWAKAGIPTQQKKHVVAKIERVFHEWEILMKNKENKTKRSEKHKQRDDWKNGLVDLFDIARANALDIITIEEDKAFLLAQREKGRHGKIGSIDKTLAKKEAAVEKRNRTLQAKKEHDEARLTEKVVLESSSDLGDTDSIPSQTSSPGKEHRNTSKCESEPSTSKEPPRKRGRSNILNAVLAASLDVAKLSDRKAASVLVPAIQHLGRDPSKYNVNSSSIRRERIKWRKAIAECIKKNFMPNTPLTIHWDGKLLEDITGKEIVDRLPILVSGSGVDQLLGVPKLQTGTGAAASDAIYDATPYVDQHVDSCVR